MSGSAKIARERLEAVNAGRNRADYGRWAARVEELLELADTSMGDLPQLPFRAWHRAGVPAWVAAATALGSGAAMRLGSRRLDG